MLLCWATAPLQRATAPPTRVKNSAEMFRAALRELVAHICLCSAWCRSVPTETVNRLRLLIYQPIT
jgi:hypothetical protein